LREALSCGSTVNDFKADKVGFKGYAAFVFEPYIKEEFAAVGVDTAQLALERAVSCAYVSQKSALLLIDRLHHQIDNSR